MNQKNDNVKSVSIRIPSQILHELRIISNYEGRSINSQILYLINQCINKFKKEHTNKIS